MITRPMPGRPAAGGGLAVLVVVTVMAVLAAPQLGRLRPLVDQLRQANPPTLMPLRPTPARVAMLAVDPPHQVVGPAPVVAGVLTTTAVAP